MERVPRLSPTSDIERPLPRMPSSSARPGVAAAEFPNHSHREARETAPDSEIPGSQPRGSQAVDLRPALPLWSLTPPRDSARLPVWALPGPSSRRRRRVGPSGSPAPGLTSPSSALGRAPAAVRLIGLERTSKCNSLWETKAGGGREGCGVEWRAAGGRAAGAYGTAVSQAAQRRSGGCPWRGRGSTHSPGGSRRLAGGSGPTSRGAAAGGA